MPIYEYICEGCGHEFETIQKFSDAPLTDCPRCAAARLVKKISAAGFRLKGGGWYETDFKSAGKRNVAGDGVAADAPSPAAASTNAGDGGGKEGKSSESAPVATPKATSAE